LSVGQTELLFPIRVIPALVDLRGEEWRELTNTVIYPDASLTDQMGFVLMMVRLAGCVSCNSDSYRAMRGCAQCACQVIRRYKGDDLQLTVLLHQARLDASRYMEKVYGVEKSL
jgi:hypothetical protein